MEFHFALLPITIATNQTPSYPHCVEHSFKGLKQDGAHTSWMGATNRYQLSLEHPAFPTALAISASALWTRTWFPTLFSRVPLLLPLRNKKQSKRPSTFFMQICKVEHRHPALLETSLTMPTFPTWMISWSMVKSEEASTNVARSPSYM